ncbi:MAG: L,D-transpeptidase [Gammaproteobacteria bacterium]|nr:L,D-transpeptidase [Gammaproteobacteria bacterium]MDH5800941.1 L,D-transpeptidase [Gammaproteobacteria bacterium]
MASLAFIEVSIAQQRLRLRSEDKVLMDVSVATAKNGPGEVKNSECTPRGLHKIRAKIGSDCDPGTVFVGRRPTGEVYQTSMKQQHPNRDWILTRIMWLSGLEPGRNRFGNVDTMSRYVYIHGCPDDDAMGVPSSHGCIKMRNLDVISLFELVEIGTRVNIMEGPLKK